MHMNEQRNMRQALNKSLRGQLEKTVTKGRKLVEKAAREEIERLGVGESSAPSYLQEADAKLRNQLRAHGRSLGDIKAPDSSQQIDLLVREVAYEQWHRMLFAYFLAQNDLLIYEGWPISIDDCAEAAQELDARSGWEAAGILAAKMLPQVFRATSPALKIILPLDAVQELEALIKSIHPDTFQAQDALGWLYQFWQTDRKEAVNASGVKIGARELSPVTQLFTEPYMVSFLLDNALGAWWANRKLSQNDLTTTTTEAELRLSASVPGVPLNYLRFIKPDADQAPSEQNAWAPAAGNFEQWPQQLSELTVIDPCCGSGHFLVAAFLMLVPLRMADEGLTAKQAIDAVLSQNLHGLELDQRCVELAAFAIALEAWRYPDENGKPLGYRQLPELQLACSGMAIGAAKGEWKQLAKHIATQASDNTEEKKKNLSIALDWLQKTFEHAPVLGSLINPQRSDAAKIVDWPKLQEGLNQALENSNDEPIYEAQIAAQGLTKAAELLSNKYTWVITNVPYLGRTQQDSILTNFSDNTYPLGKSDLATVFLERCLEFCNSSGIAYVVMPQNWLFLSSYTKYREKLILNSNIDLLIKLGSGAFESISGEVVKAILLGISREKRGDPISLSGNTSSNIIGFDVSKIALTLDKAESLKTTSIQKIEQADLTENPNQIISLDAIDSSMALEKSHSVLFGSGAGDKSRFVRGMSELQFINNNTWNLLQGSPSDITNFSGRTDVILWENENGAMKELADSVKHLNHKAQQWRSGKPNWGKKGVVVSLMSNLPTTLYDGEIYEQQCAAIVPFNQEDKDLIALWCFCASGQFSENVRLIDQKLSVTPGSILKTQYDVDYWVNVANEKYPNGLPQPYTNDPTQWIFHGHPCGSVIWSEESKWTEHGELRIDDTVLQVATARLLGYRWPAELDSEMELAVEQREWVNRCDVLLGDLVDDDGIVCLPALRGEATAAHRLELMLEAAYGDTWSNTVRDKLLAEVKAPSLEAWLRDKFFEQHCKLFQHRPFIWQIWDGLKDGFSALVNYHQLDANNLDRLIYTYLNDWISQQAESVKQGVDGAEIRLSAAQALKAELEVIKAGEATRDGGYDIFVRWKPLHEQAIGWQPDLNDGVRLNIRPFMTAQDMGKKGAGVLRAKPNIHWKKDRGTDVATAPWYHLGEQLGGKKGDRINDHHLSIAEKQQAREAFEQQQQEQRQQEQRQREEQKTQGSGSDDFTLTGNAK